MTNSHPLPVLKRMRRLRGPLRVASRDIGVTKAALVRWDNMITEPKARYREAYAKFLGISVGRLGALIYRESVKPKAPRKPVQKRAEKA